ncbi:MAG: UDP-N-acetylmuramate dehydrogenase [Clostridia bacterium]|nr:UDP-N-acetylmuramate dehydrogenase [Clostridia bacterium]
MSDKNLSLLPKERTAKELTTIKCGGVCKNVFEPKSTAEFLSVIRALENLGEKPFVLGGGSNVLVQDGEMQTPVVLTKHLDKIRIENGFAFAECGAKISEILRRAREHNLGGLEFLAGVPLTLGGACKMNASAFGKQFFDLAEGVFVYARAYDERDVCEYAHIIQVRKEDIDFGYRKGAEGIVVGAAIKLEKIDERKSVERARGFLEKRREKQPRGLSLGSVFKNGAQPAGKTIEGCGLKGLKIGGAQISELHANFIINDGTATASDFLALVEICEREVEKKYNVKLEREFVLLR